MSHRPRKRFGQNFLHDPAVIGRIVTAIDPRPDELLIEIGPGEGALTLPLLARAGALIAVELDRDLIAPLAERAQGRGRLEILNQDALTLDLGRWATPARQARVVGNLPYNISTPLLFHLLEQRGLIHDMLFMLQREVVERMAAAPGSKRYGRLSLMLQLHCEVEPLFTIGPGAFRPPPQVDSMVVRLRPLAQPRVAVADLQRFAAVVAAAFSLRRKTLRNSLRGLIDPDTLTELGIDSGLRPEQIDIAAFARIADASGQHQPNREKR